MSSSEHYQQASFVLSNLELRRGGIKSLVFQSDFTNKKLVYAVVAETMKYANVLQILLRMLYTKIGYVENNHSKEDCSGDLFASENKWLVRVMIYDLLFGSRKNIGGHSVLKAAIMNERHHLELCLQQHMKAMNVATHKELLPIELRGKGGAKLPRYARVNTLKITMQEGMDTFDPLKRAAAKAERTRLWHATNGPAQDVDVDVDAGSSASSSSSSSTSSSSSKKKKASLNTKKTTKKKIEYDAVDVHVRNLLKFPAGKDLHNHPLVTNGSLILQDKSSCFSAQILADSFSLSKKNIQSNSSKKSSSLESSQSKSSQSKPSGMMHRMDMIDACAAPGNKTSHLASLMASIPSASSKSKIFAFDKSIPRLDVLKRRMKEAGANVIVQPNLQSFLEVDPYDKKYQHVVGILLDPSCSGSGMASRLDHFMDVDKDEDEEIRRLTKLADFQKEALLKAFSFPNVTKVVYSTCSIHNEENEHVVLHALQSERAQPSSLEHGPFTLETALPNWQRRGRENVGLSIEETKCLVRVDPGEDDTNGFFVSLFSRGGIERIKKRNKNKKRKEKRKLAKLKLKEMELSKGGGLDENETKQKKSKKA